MGLFPVFYIGRKLWTRAPLVPYAQMDFQSGLQEVLDATYVLPFCRCFGDRRQDV